MNVSFFNQIKAIAWLTLKENLRSRVFLVLLGTGVAVTSISIFFPVIGGIKEKLLLVESICLKSITFFGMIIAAVLAATSIPKDIEDKSIFSIITKPVSHIGLILGKILGVIYVVGITTLFLGAFSVLLIRYAIPVNLVEEAVSRETASNSLQHKNIKLNTEIANAGYLTARKQVLSVTQTVKGEHRKSYEGTIWVDGGKGTSIWTMSGLKSVGLGEYIEMELDPVLEGGEFFVPLKLSAINHETGEREALVVNAKPGEKFSIFIDSRMAMGSNDFVVEISAEDPEHYFGLNQEKVKVFYNSGSFEYNFLKAVMIIFFQIMLIIFIGVAGSTFLKTPAVSIFFVLFFFLCGYSVDYLKDFSVVIASESSHDHHGHNHGHDDEDDHESESDEKGVGVVTKAANNMIKYLFGALTYVIPNFKKFNSEIYILNRVDIPLKKLFFLFGYASIYFSACIGGSMVIVRKQEI